METNRTYGVVLIAAGVSLLIVVADMEGRQGIIVALAGALIFWEGVSWVKGFSVTRKQ